MDQNTNQTPAAPTDDHANDDMSHEAPMAPAMEGEHTEEHPMGETQLLLWEKLQL